MPLLAALLTAGCGRTLVEPVTESPCAAVDCSGHGTCAVIDGAQAACLCDAGFHAAQGGLSCEANVPGAPCQGVDCNSGGICAVSGSDPICVCGPGYSALGPTTCVPDETPGDPCLDQDCSGHGLCAVIAGIATVCICDPGYHAVGMRCVADDPADACTDPQPEACDGIDNDCDTQIDEGACSACRCEYWAGTDVAGTIPAPRWTSGFQALRSAFDGQQTLAFLTGGDQYGGGSLTISLRHVDGSTLGVDHALTTSAAASYLATGFIDWDAGRWLAAWTGDSGAGVAALDQTGTTTIGPVILASIPGVAGFAAAGGSAYVLYGGASFALAQRLDGALALAGAPIGLAPIKGVIGGRRVGDAVAVLGAGEPGTTYYLALLRGGALAGIQALEQVSAIYTPPFTGVRTTVPVALDADGLAVCWTFNQVWCRYLSPVNARPLGPAFVVSFEGTGIMDLARAECSMALMIGRAWGRGQASLMYHFDPSGRVDTLTVDRRWIGDTEMRLFAADDGRLIRVLNGDPLVTPGISRIVTTDLRCRTPPAPVDCSALQDLACSLACDAADVCPAFSTECMVLAGTSGSGFAAATCPAQIGGWVDCDTIDTARCAERLAEPQSCDQYGWFIPADCVLPR